MWLWSKRSKTGRTSSAIAVVLSAFPDGSGASQVAEREEGPVHTILDNGLLVGYVADVGHAYSHLMYEDLRRDRITQEELHAIGIANLAKVAAEQLDVRSFPGFYAIGVDGYFEASMVLVDDLWDRRLRQLVEGEYLAAIPARDVLAFCDASSWEGRAKLEEVIDTLMPEARRPISRHLYRRVGGRWVREPQE
jgi:uncharacterized protein YtpQ (UPF0354 family)